MKSIVLFAAVLRIIIIIALIGFTIFANAQSVAVNTTGNPADTSAMLDVSSNSKGFLPPRMTTIQRTSIPTPANGLIVFDTDTKTYWYYSDAWKEVPSGGSGGGLSLPYIGSYVVPSRILSLTNTNTLNGAGAIQGKVGSDGSGMTLNNTTAGVWGDNTAGIGVLGMANTGIGVYGKSVQNYGVYGYTSSSSSAAIIGEVMNGATGIYGLNSGGIGKAAIFENTNNTNNDTLMKLEHKGTGGGIMLNLSNSNNSSKGIAVINKGNGNGLYSKSEKGISALFEGHANANTSAVVQVNNESSGNNAVLINQKNTNNNKAALAVENFGMEKALYLTTNNGTNNKYLVSGTQLGVGGGIELSINQPTASGDGLNILNYGTGDGVYVKSWSGVGVYAETMEGGTAVYGKATKPSGAAIYATNDGVSGQAIRGSATGSDGVAIYGEGGNSASNSYAGFFRNSNATNTRDVVQIYNQGAGKSLVVNNINSTNGADLIQFRNSGTGKFVSLVTGSGDIKTTIDKQGNLVTDGTLTVNGGNGIIRNTGVDQLRYEVISAAIPSTILQVGEVMEHTIFFPTPFSSAPAVTVGNFTAQQGLAADIVVSIVNVTTTSCKLFIRNVHTFAGLTVHPTINLIAIGKG